MGINNFIYLGFNSESGIFSDKLLRQAVNLAINRKEIVTTAFQGHAREAYSPFNPDWYALASKDLIITGDTQKAIQLIEESGTDLDGITVSLLVNKDNQFKLETAEYVKTSLESLGFEVNLKDYETEYYTEAVEMGAFDIYIGEIRLSPNMDLHPLLSAGSVSYGIDPENEACIRYEQFLAGECELMDFINSFNENLPLVPICYRNAAASYTNAMNSDFNCCDADVFYDIETWSFK
jgi:peptide/nickel transport system substrate-binding protein